MRTRLLLALACVASVSQAQVCPTNQYFAPLVGHDEFSTAAFRTAVDPNDDVGYDLRTGSMVCRVTTRSFAELRLHDAFQVVGPPGPALPFLVTLSITPNLTITTFGPVDVHNCAYANTSATMVESADAAWGASIECEGSLVTPPQRFHLPVSHVPGETFTIVFTLTLSTNSTSSAAAAATAVASYGFTGLPAGYSVRSCQGYAYAPVPTRATSWGRLKSIYR
jgi:hypothetical protein